MVRVLHPLLALPRGPVADLFPVIDTYVTLPFGFLIVLLFLLHALSSIYDTQHSPVHVFSYFFCT